MTAPVPPSASPDGRMEAVRRLESTALGSDGLQRLTGLAVRLLAADGAAVSLVGDVETVVGGSGLPTGSLGRQVPLADSLGAVALANGGGPLVVPDARRDPRLADRPPVADGGVGAYLGVPLVVSDGSPVGALAAYARASREWTASDVALLRQLADAAAIELELAATAKEFEAHRLRFELAIDAAKIGSFDWDLVVRAAGLGRPARGDLRLHPRDVRRDDRGLPRPMPSRRRRADSGGAAVGHRHLRGVRVGVPGRAAVGRDPLGPGPRPRPGR